jgi:hypothetical protein
LGGFVDSRWHAVVVESADPARLGRWWAEVLDYRILGEDANHVLVGIGQGQPALSFTRVSSMSADGAPHPVNGRLRIDVWTDDCEAQVERLVNMGARHIDAGAGVGGSRLVVLADPEGNEFCLTGARQC